MSDVAPSEVLPRWRVMRRRRLDAEKRAQAALAFEELQRERDLERKQLARVCAERAELSRRLAFAQTDPLTGTYTRASGLEVLDRELSRSRRTGGVLVVAYVDIVGLKAVNDSEGHAAGDVLLKTVVRHIRDQLRSYDLVLRLGGDEFLCAMPGMTLADARRRFAQVTAALSAAPEAGAIRTGLAERGPDEDSNDLIARADADMASGRKSEQLAPTGPRPEGRASATAASLSLALAGGPLAPARARAALGVFMDEIGSQQLALLELMVTELVSNSVVHGGAGVDDRITVQVIARRHTVHGEVSDSGAGFVLPRLPAAREIGGLGLVIVDRGASRWGTTHEGRRVWFELDRSPAASEPQAAPTAASSPARAPQPQRVAS